MLLAYDGTEFRGFARNAGVRTVGGELRRALEQVLGSPVELAVAGRTDAGVHARGQVVSFDVGAEIDLDPRRVRRSLLSMLAPEVVVRSLEPAPDGFHPRFSACWRSYRYVLQLGPAPDPARARSSWWLTSALDVPAMREAAGLLVGEHDFSAFCRRPKRSTGAPASLVREVLGSRWWHVEDDWGEWVIYEVRARAFCHQMVRSVVGTLVDVGRGRMTVRQVGEALLAGDRALAGQLAPPLGLTLWAVGYEEGELAAAVSGPVR
jgi:tRNA pseudouridine38-40 synthase